MMTYPVVIVGSIPVKNELVNCRSVHLNTDFKRTVAYDNTTAPIITPIIAPVMGSTTATSVPIR